MIMHSRVLSVGTVPGVGTTLVAVVSGVKTSGTVEDTCSAGVQRDIVAVLISIDAFDDVDLPNRVLRKVVRPATWVSSLDLVLSW
jgi:hypothetical protein